MHTFLGVPVLIRGEPWGNLYLTEKAGGPFDEARRGRDRDPRRLGRAGGRQRAPARGRGAPPRRGRARRPAARGDSAIARAVGSETDLDRVLELIVKRGRALLDARAVVLLLAEGDQLRLAAGAGQVSSAAIGGSFPLAGSAAGEVLFSGRPARLDDVPSRLRSTQPRRSAAPPPRCSCRSSTATRRSACSPRSTASPATRRSTTRRSGCSGPSRRARRPRWRPRARWREDRLRHSIAAGRAGAPALGARAARRDAAGARRRCSVLLSSALRRGDAEALERVGARGDRLHRHRDRRPAHADHGAAPGGARRDRARAGDREPRPAAGRRRGPRGRDRGRGRWPAGSRAGDDRVPDRAGGADQHRQARARRTRPDPRGARRRRRARRGHGRRERLRPGGAVRGLRPRRHARARGARPRSARRSTPRSAGPSSARRCPSAA